MREIEFRGKAKDGKIFYGDLNHVEIRNYSIGGKITSLQSFTVNGEIVDEYAQFVGRDIDGVKVYEGDVLIDDVENEYPAEIYMRPGQIAQLKFKR